MHGICGCFEKLHVVAVEQIKVKDALKVFTRFSEPIITTVDVVHLRFLCCIMHAGAFDVGSWFCTNTDRKRFFNMSRFTLLKHIVCISNEAQIAAALLVVSR